MTALILIDLQKGFLDPSWGPRSNPALEANIRRLLSHWRERQLPLIHIQHVSRSPHSPFRPAQPGVEFMDCATPLAGEPPFQKSAHGAFVGTPLETHLRAIGASRLVIAGLAADHCVSTTTRMANDLGFDVLLPADTTATFDRDGQDGVKQFAQSVHAITLASLHREFAEITTLDDVLETFP